MLRQQCERTSRRTRSLEAKYPQYGARLVRREPYVAIFDTFLTADEVRHLPPGPPHHPDQIKWKSCCVSVRVKARMNDYL